MDLPLSLVLPLLGILVLTILVTGPGMWSEEWGWWWVRKRPADGKKPGEDPGRPPPRP
jgi:hypothetical protein